MSAPPPRLSIVHVLAPAPFGGLESVVRTLAAAQREDGDAVRVAVVVGKGEGNHPFVHSLERRGVQVETIAVGARQYLVERRQVREILERHGADVLHTHGYRPDFVDAPVARGLGIPTVTTVHGFTGGGGFKGRLYERLQLRAFRSMDAVIAVSDRLRGELIRAGVPASRVHTVRNAYALEGDALDREQARRALGIDTSGRVIGWVGRMSAEKAPDVAIRVLAAMTTPDVGLALVGSGPLEGECRELAASYGVADRVRWLGVVEHAGRSVRAFDAVLLTSWTEGTPVVLLEAMAAGVPVVSTAVGGIPESIGPDSGWLTQAGDVSALASGLDELCSNAPLAATRAAAARARLENERAVGPWMEEHRRIYRSLVTRS